MEQMSELGTDAADPALESAADPAGSLASFHPLVRDWFQSRFEQPTDAQRAGWPAIAGGRDVLIAAPTGSGKTLTAFLAGIDGLVRRALDGRLAEGVAIVYVSPLKALSNDIQRNLEEPLRGIQELAEERGIELPRIRAAVRTGDTTQSDRQAMLRRPPHILITTPESLYLMLTAEKSRALFGGVETLIVDEIHALVRDKRGSHLSLTLARLDHVAERRPTRVGLSATQKPMDEIAAYLVGQDPASGAARECQVLDLGHQRDLRMWLETMEAPLTAVATHELWDEIYDRLAALIAEHRTTLIFVNTRQLAERVAHRLSERVGKENVASHHGSLAKERRLQMEQRLKAGDLRALVATASLELGIDIGSIDLVCQIGSPRRIATFLQRVGRSGHALGLTPQGALFPTTIDELIECSAMVRAIRGGNLDRIFQPTAPIEVLAQQIVAEVAAESWSEDGLFALVRQATPYQALARQTFDETVEMLANGIGEGGGQSKPLLHRDRINGLLRARRGARMTALQNGGVIPESGDYAVIKEPEETRVGTVNEDFAIESNAGDIFLLGSTSWRIRRVETEGVVRVEDAHGAPPTIPFWLGEAPGRSLELSEAIGAFRRSVLDGLSDPEALNERLRGEIGLSETGTGQIIDYLKATHDSLGIVPSDVDVVFERFFDEAGGQQLVLHAPFGSGINRAWGLALRKRFCVRFDFELQAAANEEGVILSLGPAQSFPLEEAFDYLKSGNAEQALRQAVLYAPFWNTRWRWAATRALAVPRMRAGKKVPPFIQRMVADDLLASVFPAQVGCQENLNGPLEVPDHPLVAQTVEDCLHEAIDTDGLVEILGRIEAGTIRMHARDTVEPSPMAQSILNVNPYGFLDDAPLEERRARAVMTRRYLPDNARDLGALDADAIDRVREEARSRPRDAEELHDALLSMVAVAAPKPEDWAPWLPELETSGRAARLTVDGRDVHLAAENLALLELLFPHGLIQPLLELPEGAAEEVADREEARLRLVRGHMEVSGPLTAAQLAERCGLEAEDIEHGLQQAEVLGEVMRGRFTTTDSTAHEEYCDRRLLARIHRYTINRLRSEVEPVTTQDYARFLLRWQYAGPERLQGKAGLREAIRRLQGFEAPASVWERELLPGRVADYRQAWLDELCLAGEVTWARLKPRDPSNGKGGSNGNGSSPSRTSPTRSTPITIALREDFPDLLTAARWTRVDDQEATALELSGAAGAIHEQLRRRGALFFDELVRNTRRLATDVENGLRELVALGRVHADGFEGLRQLTSRRRGNGRAGARRRPRYGGGGVFIGQGPAGRWALLPTDPIVEEEPDKDDLAERIALVLLERYGVLFRELALRERFGLPWRSLLRALRRLEARGEIRGGRFVGGRIGEQFALPQAVEALRAVRRAAASDERSWISAADPCNLSGILLPGPRIPARAGNTIALIDGVPATQTPEPSALTAGG